jgi:hypothetical protein
MYAVSWDATLHALYNSSVGGYDLNILAQASSTAYGAPGAGADFANTVRLTGVTFADGSALGVPFTFDSGFQLASAVPEPSTLTLGLFGCLAGLAACRFRRQAA